jgi:hypothetical protein
MVAPSGFISICVSDFVAPPRCTASTISSSRLAETQIEMNQTPRNLKGKA